MSNRAYPSSTDHAVREASTNAYMTTAPLMTRRSLREAERNRKPAKMPLGALLAMAAAGFVTMMAEAMPVGLLIPISQDLNVSNSQAGQLVGVYALGCAGAALPLTALTRGLPRKPLLMALMAVFFATTAMTANLDSFPVILGARLVAGMSAGVVWAMLAGYAVAMAPQGREGKAMAIAMFGTPLALALGIPAGTFLGDALTWRQAFGVMAWATIALIGIMAAVLPNVGGEPKRQRPSILGVMRIPGMMTVTGVTVMFALGHNIAYTYIANIMGLSGQEHAVANAQLAFGAAAAGGLYFIGTQVDARLRQLIQWSTAALAVVLVFMALVGSISPLMVAAILVWGLIFGGTPTLVQTGSALNAGESRDVGQAVIVTAWNTSVALAAWIGGAALDVGGARTVLVVAAVVAAGGYLLTRRNPEAFRAAQERADAGSVPVEPDTGSGRRALGRDTAGSGRAGLADAVAHGDGPSSGDVETQHLRAARIAEARRRRAARTGGQSPVSPELAAPDDTAPDATGAAVSGEVFHSEPVPLSVYGQVTNPALVTQADAASSGSSPAPQGAPADVAATALPHTTVMGTAPFGRNSAGRAHFEPAKLTPRFLLNLEETLSQRVIGQAGSVNAVVRAMARAANDHTVTRRPLGAFYLVGPQGVGKTELINSLAEELYGSAEAVVRIPLHGLVGHHARATVFGDSQRAGLLPAALAQRGNAVLVFESPEDAPATLGPLIADCLATAYVPTTSGEFLDLSGSVVLFVTTLTSQSWMDHMSEPERCLRGAVEQVRYRLGDRLVQGLDAVAFMGPLMRSDLRKIAAQRVHQLAYMLGGPSLRVDVSYEAQERLARDGQDLSAGAQRLIDVVDAEVTHLLAQALPPPGNPNGVSLVVDVSLTDDRLVVHSYESMNTRGYNGAI